MATTTPFPSYWPKISRFDGACAYCTENVPAGSGFTWKDRSFGWVVSCGECYQGHARAFPVRANVECGGDFHQAQTPRNHSDSNSYNLMRCTGCSGEVVWYKSAKSGKWYLANVTHGHAQANTVLPWKPHKCEAAV
jgi:hypothetical protein